MIFSDAVRLTSIALWISTDALRFPWMGTELLALAGLGSLAALVAHNRQRYQPLLTFLKPVNDSKAQLKELVEEMQVGLLLLDPSANIVLSNQAAAHLLQLTPAQLEGKVPFHHHLQIATELGTPLPFSGHPIQQVINTCQPLYDQIFKVKAVARGDWRWLSITVIPQLSPEGALQRVMCTFHDVTLFKQAEESLKTSHQRFAWYVQQSPLAVIEWDLHFRVKEWNPAAETLFGYTREEIIGRCATDLIMPPAAVPQLAQIWGRLADSPSADGQNAQHAIENTTKSGQLLMCEWHHTLMVDDTNQAVGVISLVQDITERQEIEKRLIHNAYHDPLTGLPNRALFMKHLERAIAVNRRSTSGTCAVFFIDVDRFKFINDSLGHSIGDSLLVELAHRLKTCLRSSDLIARLGGDEFAVLMPNLPGLSRAAQVAERMQKVLSQPFFLLGHDVFTSVSIGIASPELDGDRAEVLLRNADAAMYSAKESGGASYFIFTPELHARALTRLELETDLRRAVERQEFLLHYQPIVSLRSKIIVGFEALIRWQHPKRGFVSPGDFIPMAEETGLIAPIGLWVMQEACRQVRQWQQRFPTKSPFFISVNLSAVQFLQPKLIDEIQTVLAESNLSPNNLKLEITESVIMSSTDYATKVLDRLKQIGVKFAIDDFGTGYSSLSYLHRFPVDTLKIDRSFISQLDTDVEKVELVRTILSLAWNLGMDVVAEGVETQKHLAQLRLLKCDYGQGYLFAKPLANEQITSLLSQYGPMVS
ncbi:MAG: EAL domain-containing protein [Synechococcales bacterium]|nr:EAL domain-containing protein [Synechococcales bacterium]